jgi:hypothetical protein
VYRLPYHRFAPPGAMAPTLHITPGTRCAQHRGVGPRASTARCASVFPGAIHSTAPPGLTLGTDHGTFRRASPLPGTSLKKREPMRMKCHADGSVAVPEGYGFVVNRAESEAQALYPGRQLPHGHVCRRSTLVIAKKKENRTHARFSSFESI